MSKLATLLLGVGGGVPTVPGTPYGGGYYAGRIQFLGRGQVYALVVAPKAQGGESDGLQLRTTQSPTTGTDSEYDGWVNTQAMIQAGSAIHPAAAFCRGLNINGYDDWFLPSMYELEIIYRNLKPTTASNVTSFGANRHALPPTVHYTTSDPTQTNAEVFKQGGGEDFSPDRYWASTQYAGGGFSRGQNFDTGQLLTNNKTITNRVRAIRRVAIEE